MPRNENFFRYLFETDPAYHAVISAKGRARAAEKLRREKEDPAVIARKTYMLVQRARKHLWGLYKRNRIGMDKGTKWYPITSDTKPFA